MCGGENKLVEKDRALLLSLYERGYEEWRVGDEYIRNMVVRRAKEEPRQKTGGFVNTDVKTNKRALTEETTNQSQPKRIKLSDLLSPDPVPVERPHSPAPTTTPLLPTHPIPLQPAQSPVPVPVSQHGLWKLPSLIRGRRLVSLPPAHWHDWRRQRNFHTDDSLDSATMQMAQQGPAAEYRYGMSSVDRDMLRGISEIRDVGKVYGEFRNAVYRRHGHDGVAGGM